MFDVNRMGEWFLRLVRLEDSMLWDSAVEDNAAELADGYIVAEGGEVEQGSISAAELGPVLIIKIVTVSVHAASPAHNEYRGRWIAGSAVAVQDAQGRVWLDSALHNLVFV